MGSKYRFIPGEETRLAMLLAIARERLLLGDALPASGVMLGGQTEKASRAGRNRVTQEVGVDTKYLFNLIFQSDCLNICFFKVLG